tara:strand:- start:9 stop:185 length:177 start_codon:yes stop_codon:yes gene_type:complete
MGTFNKSAHKSWLAVSKAPLIQVPRGHPQISLFDVLHDITGHLVERLMKFTCGSMIFG